jgi:cobalt/nickel transport system ATP-binding protein
MTEPLRGCFKTGTGSEPATPCPTTTGGGEVPVPVLKQPLIRFHDVTFAYQPDRPVLAACDFCLRPGQRLALVGANGSGKTTLLHLMVGLVRPTAGRIEAFGRERRSESDFFEVRCRAGLLFQESDDQLFSPTVAEDVAFGPLNLGKPRAEVRQLVAESLALVGLEGYEHRITYKLSSGEKRRVALATVLAMKPDVLLLDEPANGLDEATTERLVELLTRLPQAMVLVSHHREFWQRIATSALRLEAGRLVS